MSTILGEDTSEIEVKMFEEVIFKKKGKKAIQPVEQCAPIHVSLVLCSCRISGVCNESFKKEKTSGNMPIFVLKFMTMKNTGAPMGCSCSRDRAFPTLKSDECV